MHTCKLRSLTVPLGSLNGARGSLRTKLHSRLYDPCWSLLGSSTCKIKEKVFYQYHKALKETGAWPLEIQGYRHSIIELLRLLKRGDSSTKTRISMVRRVARSHLTA